MIYCYCNNLREQLSAALAKSLGIAETEDTKALAATKPMKPVLEDKENFIIAKLFLQWFESEEVKTWQFICRNES